jgi:hypothetical protein
MFAGVEESLRAGNRDPFTRAGSGGGFEVFGIKIAILCSLEAELHGRRRRIIDGGLEFRIGTRLDPEESADAETRNENQAGDERTQAPQVGLE